MSAICSPSRRIVTLAVPSAALPRSSTWKVTSTLLPTRPKVGDWVTMMRRSRPCGLPVMARCTGAVMPSSRAAPGTSCTCPSVTSTRPARRFCGMSASASRTVSNSWVPFSAWSLPPLVSTTRRSRSSKFFAVSRSFAMVASASAARFSRVWLGDRSTTTRRDILLIGALLLHQRGIEQDGGQRRAGQQAQERAARAPRPAHRRPAPGTRARGSRSATTAATDRARWNRRRGSLPKPSH